MACNEILKNWRGHLDLLSFVNKILKGKQLNMNTRIMLPARCIVFLSRISSCGLLNIMTCRYCKFFTRYLA